MDPSERTLMRPTPKEMAEWRQKIKELYPEWNKKMYSLPTVHFTKNLCQDMEIAGKPVKVLKKLETGSSSVSVSQPSGSAPTSVASQRGPATPTSQSTATSGASQSARSELKGRTKGDFDILIIHRSFGILIGEVKSSGFQTLGDRLAKIVEQLEKSESFVKQALADIAPNILIRKTVILPYVSRSQLQNFLGQDSSSTLPEKLRVCVGVQNAEDIFQMCLLEDQMLGHADSLQVSATDKAHLETWWHTRMACTEDPGMSEELYLQLLARFCGPATTVRVYCPERPNLALRTDSEAVSAIGEVLSASLHVEPNPKLFPLMLTEDQFSLVQYDQRKMVFVTGPPGTGKSIVLLLKGVRWLKEGHDVHVVSTRWVSFAVCSQIVHQLKKMTSGDVGSGEVYFHDYDFWNREADAEKAVQDLTSAAESDGELYVLMDEYATNPKYRPTYENLLTSLSEACPTVYVWTASVRNKNIPSAMKEERLDVPLRCPRNVLCEIQQEVENSDDIYKYDTSRFHHLPLGGPKVQRVLHSGEGHEGEWPVDCFQCGSEIGQILHVLIGGAAGASASADTSPPPLTFSDVFILTRSSRLQDSSPFVRGLRDRQIPVLLLSDPTEGDGRAPADIHELKQQLARVARSEIEDQVVVARHGCVCGLERKVVVRLPGKAAGVDDKRNMKGLEHHDRVHAMSRCAAHLIIIWHASHSPYSEEEAM